jgi:hypothetical protein
VGTVQALIACNLLVIMFDSFGVAGACFIWSSLRSHGKTKTLMCYEGYSNPHLTPGCVVRILTGVGYGSLSLVCGAPPKNHSARPYV